MVSTYLCYVATHLRQLFELSVDAFVFGVIKQRRPLLLPMKCHQRPAMYTYLYPWLVMNGHRQNFFFVMDVVMTLSICKRDKNSIYSKNVIWLARIYSFFKLTYGNGNRKIFHTTHYVWFMQILWLLLNCASVAFQSPHMTQHSYLFLIVLTIIYIFTNNVHKGPIKCSYKDFIKSFFLKEWETKIYVPNSYMSKWKDKRNMSLEKK